MKALEPVYKYEIEALHILQQLPCFTGCWEYFWLVVTKFGDPAWTFVVYFPFLYPLTQDVALRFIVSGAISEFINAILKWFLHGDRPYWFIQEHEEFSSADNLSLKQFKVTCETGPGSPSGHAMVTASVFFVLLRAVNKNCTYKRFFNRLYVSLLILVSVSRLYIAAHFPHQVFLGIACGVAVGYVSSNVHPIGWKLHQPLLLAAFLSVAGIASYVILYVQGYNPNWSLYKARKHCARPEWIHLSTTPQTGLFRDVGCLMGLGLALQFQSWRKKNEENNYPTLIHKLSMCAMSLVIAQCFSKLPLPQAVSYVYYGFTLVLHISLAFVVVAVIPESTKWMFSVEKVNESSCANKKL